MRPPLILHSIFPSFFFLHSILLSSYHFSNPSFYPLQKSIFRIAGFDSDKEDTTDNDERADEDDDDALSNNGKRFVKLRKELKNVFLFFSFSSIYLHPFPILENAFNYIHSKSLITPSSTPRFIYHSFISNYHSSIIHPSFIHHSSLIHSSLIHHSSIIHPSLIPHSFITHPPLIHHSCITHLYPSIHPCRRCSGCLRQRGSWKRGEGFVTVALNNKIQ